MFNVAKLTDVLKFEIVRTSFDLAKSADLQDMWSARLDYRVKNTGREPISHLIVKCVWSSLNGEVLDQSSGYLVGSGDVPLGSGQTKSDFIRCGKGYVYAKVPVKADLYLESDGRRQIVVKGVLIR